MGDHAPCDWAEDADGVWWSKCGNAFVFTDNDGPEGHGFLWCPYCGQPIAPSGWIEDEVANELP